MRREEEEMDNRVDHHQKSVGEEGSSWKRNKSCSSIFSLVSSLVVFLLFLSPGVLASWDDWWTYDGISGPAFWGLINPQWSLCSKGRRQSPVNVEPSKLLYDPSLRPIHIDKTPVSGVLRNTGQTVVFTVEKGSSRVNMTGGPLAYRYQFEELYVHYGPEDVVGSEHMIQGISFPAELQLYGFNVELYSNLSDAQQKPNGVVAISIMIRVSDEEQSKSPNSELRILTSVLTQIRFRNQSAVIKTISLHGLLPETDYYMTYEGSTTHPGCWETVTWVIFNKPVYLSKQMLWALRQLRQGSRPETPKSHLLNVRPTQQMHHRTVRTNINFALAQAKKCPTMQSTTYYKANMWRPPL
ncbi:carbonic anhydrase-related protein 10 [Folsomia candida]|uniref:carbonic anhydrase-related protein 10 n=1 Tax=Folsomia candida TaxID=158441 RepID=UPI001604E632|nr:carbonic anhydrase-related protein 10 [Folsomia candida]